MKAYLGHGGRALYVLLTLALYGSGQLHTPVTLPPRKEPLVPTGEEAG
jgi:hypothetical protein